MSRGIQVHLRPLLLSILKKCNPKTNRRIRSLIVTCSDVYIHILDKSFYITLIGYAVFYYVFSCFIAIKVVIDDDMISVSVLNVTWSSWALLSSALIDAIGDSGHCVE